MCGTRTHSEASSGVAAPVAPSAQHSSADSMTGSGTIWDPAVALPVDADEAVALGEVCAVEIAGRMRARACLEHDGREPHVLNRAPRGAALGGQLLKRGAH